MNKQEAIKILKAAQTDKFPYDSGLLVEAIDMAIKALEQEPILDKLRAEISTVYESLDGYDPDSLGAFVSKIDEIFDKYKAESEPQESEDKK